MALSLSCIIIPFYIFFVFSNLYCSCPAVPVLLSCGTAKIDVRFPFYTYTTDRECRGHHLVFCNGSTPVIQFHGHEHRYVLETIDYAYNFTIIQDQEFGKGLQIPDCNIKYDFYPPIHLSENLFLPRSVSPNQSFFDCKMSGYNSSADIFHEFYNRSLCKDYKLQFSNKLEDEGPHHKTYWDGPAGLFKWLLSFGDDGDDLSLISASYLHRREGLWESFKHDTERDPTCLCNNKCRSRFL